VKKLLQQLALNSTLLPEDMAAAILAGNTPPVEDLVLQGVIGALDAHFVILGDPQSSWNEKRISRMGLVVAFLAAMAVLRGTEELKL
jgi:hypothetical protein